MSHLFGDEEDLNNDEDNQQHHHPNEDDIDDDEEDDVLDMEGTTINTQVGALLMRFCPHDSSMLYPQVRTVYIYIYIYIYIYCK